jgi:heat shock protein HtpX
MNFDGVLTQVFQPYFYYPVLFLIASFVCVKIIMRFCHVLAPRTKSLLYLIPLAIPLALLLVYVPSPTLQTGTLQFMTSAGEVGKATLTTDPNSIIASESSLVAIFSMVTVPSITGIICIIGLFLGATFAFLMLLAGDRIARKMLHVVSLGKDDYPQLQANVAGLSEKLGMAVPKMGVVEDLRPNAFTIGYGKRATVVFSIGLLNILSDEETVAVASHELAHIKNHDFFYKLLSSSLTAVSFFNPFAHIASSAAQREREMLADQHAVRLLEKTDTLAAALSKICRTIQTLPKESLLLSLSLNLFAVSSVLHRLEILSTHPRLDRRLRNISEPKSLCQSSRRNMYLSFFLLVLLIGAVVTVSYGMVNLQTNYPLPNMTNVVPTSAETGVSSLPANGVVSAYAWTGDVVQFSGFKNASLAVG